jgi:hypothetical protein
MGRALLALDWSDKLPRLPVLRVSVMSDYPGDSYLLDALDHVAADAA